MKYAAKPLKIITDSSIYYAVIIRFLLNILLLVTLAALVICIYKCGQDLYEARNKALEVILQQMLLDTVFIVALVEVINTVISYLRDGKVHVRYIVDTVLIIMLNEVVSAWFTHADFTRLGGLSLIIGVLALIRISVTRFAPQ